jgi:serine/threonine protein kinase
MSDNKIPIKSIKEDIMYENEIFTGKFDLIGHKTKSGVILTEYIVDGRKPDGIESDFDVIVYRGLLRGKTVVVKLDYSQFTGGGSRAKKANELFKKHGIEIYNYYSDVFEPLPNGDDLFIGITVMDELKPIKREQAFDMLSAIISFCFSYRSFMVHGDIKPDNIMYSPEKNKYYLIDYDSVCIEPFMYGFDRDAETPGFATQHIVAFPTIATIKNDLVELILSTSAIYCNLSESDLKMPQSMLWTVGKFTPKKIFSAIYLCALNIDERNIKNVDFKLLLLIVELTRKPENVELLSHIQKMICTDHFTNKQIFKKLNDV